MTRFLFTLLLVALPSVALAQNATIEKQINADLDAIRKAERTEDIEVLRRILNKSLSLGGKVDASCTACHVLSADEWAQHPRQWQGFGEPSVQGVGKHRLFIANSDILVASQGSHTALLPLFDAVYLSGHGVVFTLKVPASAGVVLDPANKTAGIIETCLKCHMTMAKPDAAPSQAKPTTEWDRARDELRGVKPNPEPQPAAKTQPICEPGKLTERVVAKLWANAKNVRHLPEKDQISVVVTFDGYSGSAKAGSLTPKPDGPVSGEWLGSRPFTLTDKGVPIRAGFTADEGRQLVLGDLHLKQNKPKEAIEAYRQGLSRYKELVARLQNPPSLPMAQQAELLRELEKGVRDVYKNLAQAHLMAGEVDQASAAMEMAKGFTATYAPLRKESGIPVPAKMVLTAPRTATDEAAFRKAIKVELTGFPPADRK